MAFSRDGMTLAAGYQAGDEDRDGVLLWDLTRPEKLPPKRLPVEKES